MAGRRQAGLSPVLWLLVVLLVAALVTAPLVRADDKDEKKKDKSLKEADPGDSDKPEPSDSSEKDDGDSDDDGEDKSDDDDDYDDDDDDDDGDGDGEDKKKKDSKDHKGDRKDDGGESKDDEGESKDDEGESKDDEGESKDDEGESKDDEGKSKGDEGTSKDDKGKSKDDEGKSKDDEGESKDDKGESKDDEGDSNDDEEVSKDDEKDKKDDEDSKDVKNGQKDSSDGGGSRSDGTADKIGTKDKKVTVQVLALSSNKRKSPKPPKVDYPPGERLVPPFNPLTVPIAPTLGKAPPGFVAPPDVYATLPPLPPSIPMAPIGPIRNIKDVCRVCTSLPYDGKCSSRFTSVCLTAMSKYRRDVLKIPNSMCSCYGTIATHLIETCPGVSQATAWLGNCDPYCYYGTACPFIPTLFALVSPRYTQLALGRRTPRGVPRPAPRGGALVVVDLELDTAGPQLLCYRFIPSADLPRPVSATIRAAGIGRFGPLFMPLFANGRLPPGGRACLRSPESILRKLSRNSSLFYVDLITAEGAARGQLLTSPHLVSTFTSQAAGAPCTGKVCMGTVDLALTLYSAKYTLTYTKAVRGVVAANIGKSPSRAVPGQKQFDLFGPGIAPPSLFNGVTPNADTLKSIMSDPRQYYLNITTAVAPKGGLRGQFFDSLTVFAIMYGYQVKPPSGVSGTGIFMAQIGAGGICYYFKFLNVPVQPQYAYLHQAVFTSRGPIVLSRTLQVTGTQTCVDADTDSTAVILNKAVQHYVQVYTSNHPNGLLRGQLWVAPVQAK